MTVEGSPMQHVLLGVGMLGPAASIVAIASVTRALATGPEQPAQLVDDAACEVRRAIMWRVASRAAVNSSSSRSVGSGSAIAIARTTLSELRPVISTIRNVRQPGYL